TRWAGAPCIHALEPKPGGSHGGASILPESGGAVKPAARGCAARDGENPNSSGGWKPNRIRIQVRQIHALRFAPDLLQSVRSAGLSQVEFIHLFSNLM